MYMYKNCISWCIYKRNEIEKANVKYIFRGCHGLSRLFFKKKISSLECPFPSLSFDQYTTTSLTLVYLQRIVNVEWDKEKRKSKKRSRLRLGNTILNFLSIADRFSLEKYINKIKKHPSSIAQK